MGKLAGDREMRSCDAGTVGPKSRWRRWLATLAALEEAMSLGPEEIQDRRIAKLEARLSELEAKSGRA
jgi:hypothetical protein